MALTPEMEQLYRELLLKKYKGTLTEDEQIVFADLTDRKNDLDTSSAAVADLPVNLARLVGDLDTFGGTMDEMTGKIVNRATRADAAHELSREKDDDHS